MKYFSTFSGIGGFELGIINAYVATTARGAKRGGKANKEKDKGQGLQSTQRESSRSKDRRTGQYNRNLTHEGQPTCVGFSEIDKYATKIYQKQFPHHENFGDITKINEKKLPNFDLFVGGFPCQAFSIAGKRKGFEDTRGTLFFDVARILKEKTPRLVLLENVKGLLSHDGGRTFKTIITTLAELGYAVEWQVLNAKNFGVPQNRERVYIVGHLGGFRGRQIFPIANDAGVFDQADCAEKSQSQAKPASTIRTKEGTRADDNFIAVREATKKGYAIAGGGDSVNLSVPNSKTRRGRVGKGVAQTLDTAMQQHTLVGMKLRRLTPTECERLMGFPDGHTGGVSDTQRYKTLGNGVVTNVVTEIISRLVYDQA